MLRRFARTLVRNLGPDSGHFHVAAAGRTHPCADPGCPRRGAR